MLNLDYTPPRTHPPTHSPPANGESILSTGGIIDINFMHKFKKKKNSFNYHIMFDYLYFFQLLIK